MQHNAAFITTTAPILSSPLQTENLLCIFWSPYVTVTKTSPHPSIVLEAYHVQLKSVKMERQDRAALTFVFVFIIWLGTSTSVCVNNTECNQAVMCCNGTCLDSCSAKEQVKCRTNSDCDTGQKCCDSGKCISQVSLCSLSSKLAVAIPLSLLFCFTVVVCVCSNHSSCPVYKANQRRRTGVV